MNAAKTATEKRAPVTLFISSASEDRGILGPLRDVLEKFESDGLISTPYWCGEERATSAKGLEIWEEQIRYAMAGVNLIILAISDHHLGSKWCQIELRTALEIRSAIPILAGSVTMSSLPTSITEVSLIPRVDGIPTSINANCSRVYEALKLQLQEQIEDFARDRDCFGEPGYTAPFAAAAVRIRKSLEEATSFWLLSRSGQGWWKDFGPQFDRLIDSHPCESRIMLLNPDSAAFESTKVNFKSDPTRTGGATTWDEYVEQAKAHIKRLSEKNVLLRLLDANLAYTMLLVRAKNGDSTIFVEQPKFTAGYQAGSLYTLTPEAGRLFNDCRLSFETLWEKYASPRNSPKRSPSSDASRAGPPSESESKGVDHGPI